MFPFFSSQNVTVVDPNKFSQCHQSTQDKICHDRDVGGGYSVLDL